MSKYITVENAEEFMGCVVDCHRRMFHYYPLRIGKMADGRYSYTSVKYQVQIPFSDGEKIAYDFIVSREK